MGGWLWSLIIPRDRLKFWHGRGHAALHARYALFSLFVSVQDPAAFCFVVQDSAAFGLGVNEEYSAFLTNAAQ